MKRFALLGQDIGYSLSPRIHAGIFRSLGIEASYELISVPPEKLDGAIAALKKIDGFNVTKPYKNAVAPYLTRNDSPFAAVNTVCVRGDALIGYNTDSVGFSGDFTDAFGDVRGKTALVLGAGGVAGVAVHALKSMGASVWIYNRTREKAVLLAGRFGAAVLPERDRPEPEIIVNCTVAGLHGEQALPPFVRLGRLWAAYDMIYAPPETPFLAEARRAGAATRNGLGMLIGQAIAADELFLNGTFSAQEKIAAAEAARRAIV